MSMTAVRGPLQSSIGQWAVVALGALYVANPDKFFHLLQRSAQFLLEAGPSSPNQQYQQQSPIIIHSMAGGGSGSNRSLSYIIQITVGAGLCWGSYMVMVNVLPDAAKAMLPVSRGFFSTAITSLGKGIINVRDTLAEQILGLGVKQDELSQKQDETHSEVLHVKDDVQHIRLDMGNVQQVLDDCQMSLSRTEKRQEYIGRGVRLLTRGVSSLLPQDADLAHEIDSYHRAGTELMTSSAPARVAQPSNHPQTTMVTPQQQQPTVATVAFATKQQSTPMVTADMVISPENEHPRTTVKKQDLDEIRALLQMVQYGSVQVIS